jgi:hypothetical protein
MVPELRKDIDSSDEKITILNKHAPNNRASKTHDRKKKEKMRVISYSDRLFTQKL